MKSPRLAIRPFLGLAVLAIGATTLTAPAASAEPAAVAADRGSPGARLHTNAELARTLAHLERAGHGRIDVRSMGTSNEGRPLWLATLGKGPVRLLYVTQQHGDEALGTESAIQALRTLGLGESRSARELREKITLGIVVRANPDGHERNWRYNYDPTADPEYGEPGMGYDINRYHDPAVAPGDNPVPEAAAIERTYLAFRPSIVVDYHMQGRYAFPDGREITTSILWPNHPGVSPTALNRSKQVGVRVHDAFTRAGAVVSQYPGGTYQGIARNAYGLRGSASLLIELSALPPAREHFQIRTAYESMVDLAEAAGEGKLSHIDPAKADEIPPRGPQLPDSTPATAEHAEHEAA
ncbi:M14 family zinc carboxypeptidase [Actinomadura alba]|uniref:M14 family zinc carboxypeptidase n=1 Tax=Actinomadura alba TaxID=406431 RepID=UPI0031D01B52